MDVKPVRIGFHRRFRVWTMRVFFKRLMSLMARIPESGMANIQARAAAGLKDNYSGLPLRYRVLNDVPGPVLGD